jgi:plastocyanin
MPPVMRPSASIARLFALSGAALGLLAGLSACQVADDGDNLVAGKQAFVQKCGSCHILGRAGTTGVTGPNLDEAFVRSLEDGFNRKTIRGVVRRQIQQPNRRPQLSGTNPEDDKPGALMPKDLVTGELAEDVSAYVAFAVGRKGDDTGRLADIGVKKATATVAAKNGTLEIDTDPSGALAYKAAAATAPAGALTLESKNDASIPHNIALEGPGVDEKGPIVQGGKLSSIKVTLKAGTYTFYCSVRGHREGGMVGKLTVK